MGANELRLRLEDEFSRFNDGLITEQYYFNNCFSICGEYAIADDEITFEIDKDCNVDEDWRNER